MTKQCLSKDIKISPTKGRVTVIFDGKPIANSIRALDLDEPGSPMRVYLPRADVDAAALEVSAHQTSCPYKGKASYHSLKSAGARAANAVWYYADPCPLVEPIRDYLAFWGDQIRYEISGA